MGGTRTWTVLELLRWTTEHFQSRGIETARLDAECLLAHALDTERLQLYLEFDKPVPAEGRTRFRELVKRRADERVPVALLTGRREFWSLSLRVTPDDPSLHYNLGNVRRELGALEEAVASFEAALAGAPHNASASFNLGATLLDPRRHLRAR